MHGVQTWSINILLHTCRACGYCKLLACERVPRNAAETCRIAGKFAGNYIWRNGLQVAKNKYWWNLNLAIGNHAYKFSYVIVCSYGRSPYVVRLKCEDRSRSHGRVSTRELCSRPSHIQEYVNSVVGGSTFCGFAASRSMLRLTLSICFHWVRVDDSHVIFLGSAGLSCEKSLYKAILSLHVQTSLHVLSTVKNLAGN